MGVDGRTIKKMMLMMVFAALFFAAGPVRPA
jgi:hypothetical protein